MYTQVGMYICEFIYVCMFFTYAYVFTPMTFSHIYKATYTN